MSVISDVANGVFADLEQAWLRIKGFFHSSIEPAIKTFFQVIETNGGSALVQIALQVIAAAEAGTPFGDLIKLAEDAAKAAGISTTTLAIKSALQVAQTSIQSDIAVEGVAPLATIPKAPAAAQQVITGGEPASTVGANLGDPSVQAPVNTDGLNQAG